MSVLEQMQPIGLEQMNAVRLMNRVDQKYIACVDQLETLLGKVADAYYVQHIDGNPWSSYRTLYFDTEGLAMYTMHHNGKINRQKIRVRTYCSTDATYFEIKNKDNKGKTHKVRIPVNEADFDSVFSLPEVRRFVSDRTEYPVETLHECLENRFERLTLVDKNLKERVTIDKGIRFYNRATGCKADISRLMVIEVKHEAGAPKSEIEKALSSMYILPRRMSKYCIGTALTNNDVKRSRFSRKLKYIDKIINKV